MHKQKRYIGSNISLTLLSCVFIFPIFMVLVNSFKGKLYISKMPFAWPSGKMFAGFSNYVNGIVKSGFVKAMGYSAFITIFGTLIIVLFTSMTAWYIIRVKSKFTAALYYLFVFSMIVPFQMVMFSMVKVANVLHLDNLWGILILYLGFGAGLSVFMLSGFVKAIPLDIEEAATIDGCAPIVMFFRVVFPILKPTAITVAILNAMWLWNDYLLPLLVIGNDYKTIPVAVQGVLTGSYGARDMGSLMAMLVLSIIPIIVFYLSCQKYIIKGVMAGAVKG
ncbi:MAG: carbohydrate ABC transporter permease [Ruthenibacterium sp.]